MHLESYPSQNVPTDSGEEVYIGPFPARQPISGAGLCLSPMAILQLPPFANMSKNVMWIDDSLKRTLHEAVRDIEPHDACSVIGAEFEQDRHPGSASRAQNEINYGDMQWAHDQYLPRLAYGCLMHGLICHQSNPGKPGCYAESLEKYMSTRKLPMPRDYKKWGNAAKRRIRTMKRLWSAPEYESSPAGKMLAEFANKELNLGASCSDLIEEVAKDPLAVNIDMLCSRHQLKKGRNAGAFIAQVIVDLRRYLDLLEVWPFIIRTIDFERRVRRAELEWLVRE